MTVTIIDKKNTGDIDFGTKKKPPSAANLAHRKELDGMRGEIEERVREKQGKSGIGRVTNPTSRMVMRNGKPVWIKLR